MGPPTVLGAGGGGNGWGTTTTLQEKRTFSFAASYNTIVLLCLSNPLSSFSLALLAPLCSV